MSISAYYNEFDPKAAAWLRQLIKNGDITPGEVDERSIEDVRPSDLVGFDRVHFFSGIGTWDYCLNQSEWGDRPVWTASLPCQPFSAAGKGLGKADERHLLPHFLELVRQCKPYTIFGEQVERAIAFGWLDDLQANMEAENYAVGHAVLGAHSIGAAHIRQRLYWVADNGGARRKEQPGERRIPRKENVDESRQDITGGGGMVYTNESRSQQGIETTEGARHGSSSISAGSFNGMADAIGEQREQQQNERPSSLFGASIQSEECVSGLGDRLTTSDIDWICCRDNKYRPVKSGIKPLVDGIARGMVHSGDTSAPINSNATQEARVMRLKGYGNAIQAQTAMAFISAYLSI